jgi:surface antigen Omp85-like protein
LLQIEQAGGLGVRRGFYAAFGDIKRGSGIALGPAYGRTFGEGALFEAKAGYSIRSFKLAQVALQSAPLSDGRLIFRGRARWQDAPTLPFHGLGPDSPRTRAKYSERKTEVSGEAAFRPVSLLRVGAGIGVERFDTSIASDSNSSLFTGVPGAGAEPQYLHGRVSAAIDSRAGPGYSRSGSLLGATLHAYHQQDDGPYSFQRLDGVAEQYVPVLHGNWVLYLGLRASTTSARSGQTVPFFLMPDLGGGSDLRGYGSYRFRDRHSILLTAEYRWYAQEYLDGAIFYDAGKTVPDRGALDFTSLKSSIGAGIRLHTPQSTVLRIELARSHEALRLILSFSPVGQ